MQAICSSQRGHKAGRLLAVPTIVLLYIRYFTPKTTVAFSNEFKVWSKEAEVEATLKARSTFDALRTTQAGARTPQKKAIY